MGWEQDPLETRRIPYSFSGMVRPLAVQETRLAHGGPIVGVVAPVRPQTALQDVVGILGRGLAEDALVPITGEDRVPEVVSG